MESSGSNARFDAGGGRGIPLVSDVSRRGTQAVALITQAAQPYNPSLMIDGRTEVTGKVIATGDGAEDTFTENRRPLLTPGTVVFHAVKADNSAMTLTDDEEGEFTGDGTGTVDYVTGAIEVTFEAPVKNATDVTLDYDAAPFVKQAGPTGGEVWHDVRLRLQMIGGTTFASENLAGLSGGLSSGVAVTVKGESFPVPIKVNRELMLYAGPGNVEVRQDAGGWFTTADIPVAGSLASGELVTLTIAEDLSDSPSGLSALLGVLVYRDDV